MSKRLEREILALVELRQRFQFPPLTLEGLAAMLKTKSEDIKHIVWGLWMDGTLRAEQDNRGSRRKWVLPE